MKSLNHSDTFQKRLEDQAAEAIRKAEQKTTKEYEKKLKSCLKQVEAINMRKKNDLRLVRLRKKAEMKKIEKEFEAEIEAEKAVLVEKELERHKQEQLQLKNAILYKKQENSLWQGKCQELADENKHMMDEAEARQACHREVKQHDEIIAQLDNIKAVFKEAHQSAVSDLKRLEDDCRRENKERKKIQKWIASLITLMNHRSNQPKLLKKIHKINDKCIQQRALVIDLRRARRKSSKKSQRSGTTTVLRRKVNNMRKQARAQSHILEDRASLTAELAQRRDMVKQRAQSRRDTMQRQQQSLKRQQNLQKQHQERMDAETRQDEEEVVVESYPTDTESSELSESQLAEDQSESLTDSVRTGDGSVLTYDPCKSIESQLTDDPLRKDPFLVKDKSLIDDEETVSEEVGDSYSALEKGGDAAKENEEVKTESDESSGILNSETKRKHNAEVPKVSAKGEQQGGDVTKVRKEPEAHRPKKISERASKKMNKRRQEIQKILNEMKSLDSKEDPPEEIYI